MIEFMSFADLEQVVEIEQASFPTPWSRQSFLHELMDNERAIYLVYKHMGRVWGYVGMWIILDEGHITNLAVHPVFRRRGVGNSLIRGWRRWPGAGVRHLTLEVRKSNIPAQELYKSVVLSLGIRQLPGQ